ncbi:MAG TPA: hypothetical protein VM368_01530 [Flavisolibacter sp.]|nr:hypothetical protein [Flavisolibacter sp.]
MKRYALALITVAFFACNNSSTTEIELDSLKTTIDTKTDNFTDSVESKTERLVDKAKETFNSTKDSLKKDSINN